MHESRGDRVMVFAQGVVFLARHAHIFIIDHDVRATERLGRVSVRHEARIIGCDAYRQRTLVLQGRRTLVLRQVEDALKLLQRPDTAARLPTPVIPVVRCRAREIALVEVACLRTDGKAVRLLRGLRCRTTGEITDGKSSVACVPTSRPVSGFRSTIFFFAGDLRCAAVLAPFTKVCTVIDRS